MEAHRMKASFLMYPKPRRAAPPVVTLVSTLAIVFLSAHEPGITGVSAMWLSTLFGGAAPTPAPQQSPTEEQGEQKPGGREGDLAHVGAVLSSSTPSDSSGSTTTRTTVSQGSGSGTSTPPEDLLLPAEQQEQIDGHDQLPGEDGSSSPDDVEGEVEDAFDVILDETETSEIEAALKQEIAEYKQKLLSGGKLRSGFTDSEVKPGFLELALASAGLQPKLHFLLAKKYGVLNENMIVSSPPMIFPAVDEDPTEEQQRQQLHLLSGASNYTPRTGTIGGNKISRELKALKKALLDFHHWFFKATLSEEIPHVRWETSARSGAAGLKEHLKAQLGKIEKELRHCTIQELKEHLTAGKNFVALYLPVQLPWGVYLKQNLPTETAQGKLEKLTRNAGHWVVFRIQIRFSGTSDSDGLFPHALHYSVEYHNSHGSDNVEDGMKSSRLALKGTDAGSMDRKTNPFLRETTEAEAELEQLLDSKALTKKYNEEGAWWSTGRKVFQHAFQSTKFDRSGGGSRSYLLPDNSFFGPTEFGDALLQETTKGAAPFDGPRTADTHLVKNGFPFQQDDWSCGWWVLLYAKYRDNYDSLTEYQTATNQKLIAARKVGVENFRNALLDRQAENEIVNAEEAVLFLRNDLGSRFILEFRNGLTEEIGEDKSVADYSNEPRPLEEQKVDTGTGTTTEGVFLAPR
ncbi:unnamed protein product [Amoebophrya sp. A120]|nr:unnamed protein product [Amoebophrya sp. A120]|eukprot:GSA120T00008117001.1